MTVGSSTLLPIGMHVQRPCLSRPRRKTRGSPHRGPVDGAAGEPTTWGRAVSAIAPIPAAGPLRLRAPGATARRLGSTGAATRTATTFQPRLNGTDSGKIVDKQARKPTSHSTSGASPPCDVANEPLSHKS
ncbi:hypothetical protein SVAN01_09417 [Stagonosporopsis vannaccii]|nr:hypothetical protein SVAN01_09417 [Stagonosporopsis vannaccii]